MRYTPTPWIIEDDIPFVYALNDNGYNRMSLLIQPGYTETSRTLEAELRADAHLISAAPDMYEALKLWHDHQQGTRGHYCSECANAIEKALAKAEGRQIKENKDGVK